MSIEMAVIELQHFCEEMGVKLEFIKVSGPTGIKSIHGVEFKEVIYEHDATHWLRKPTAPQPSGRSES